MPTDKKNRFIGFFVPNWLAQRKEISGDAKLCYGRLLQFAGKNGECYPKQKILAEELGASERQIKRYISELKKNNLIEIKKCSRTNKYFFPDHVWMNNKQINEEQEAKQPKFFSSYDQIEYIQYGTYLTPMPEISYPQVIEQGTYLVPHRGQIWPVLSKENQRIYITNSNYRSTDTISSGANNNQNITGNNNPTKENKKYATKNNKCRRPNGASIALDVLREEWAKCNQATGYPIPDPAY